MREITDRKCSSRRLHLRYKPYTRPENVETEDIQSPNLFNNPKLTIHSMGFRVA